MTKVTRRRNRLAHIKGAASELIKGMNDGDEPLALDTDVLVYKVGKTWSFCSIFDLGGLRYMEGYVRTSALEWKDAKPKPAIAPNYRRALAAAEDLMSADIRPIEMVVAYELHLQIEEAKSRLKSAIASNKLEFSDSDGLFNIAVGLCEGAAADATPTEAARAVVEAWVDCFGDMERINFDLDSGAFEAQYL